VKRKAVITTMLVSVLETSNSARMEFNRSDAIFDEILSFQPSKVIGISLSCVNVLFFTPLLYSIVWFERTIANNRSNFQN
jgi:hypothetical protein